MSKILKSFSVIAFVAAVALAGTGAYFSDTETSEGNKFVAGAIDLGIDNVSYYNGEPNEGTSWLMTYDLDDENGPYFYFDFKDLKPGDWGEDTISLHVNNNPAWVCAEVTLTSDEENDIVEPEADLGDTASEGELADEVYFIWWADDGDNVLEDNEDIIWPNGAMGWLGVGNTYTVTIADSSWNIFAKAANSPLISTDPQGEEIIHYIGKAWCFGELTTVPVPAGDGVNPTVNSGILCNGEPVGNISQSDSMTADISFTAVQARHNENFVCGEMY